MASMKALCRHLLHELRNYKTNIRQGSCNPSRDSKRLPSEKKSASISMLDERSVTLKKHISAQPVKKLSVFHGTRTPVTALTTTRHSMMPCHKQIECSLHFHSLVSQAPV